jgi:L-2-hydroxyglutarate oxidase LhgO
MEDVIIIGGGIIGMTIAYELRKRSPQLKITLIEKEPNVGAHASGRNSGVLHAGFYYDPDGLKARFAVHGNRLMRNFCLEKGLTLNQTGKVVVAQNPQETPLLKKLYDRGQKNGVQLSLIDEKELFELEPLAHTCEQALYSPNTASIIPDQINDYFKNWLIKNNVTLKCHTAFLAKTVDGIMTSQGKIKGKFIINCAGLYADKVAQPYLHNMPYIMIPFKGLYLKSQLKKSLLRLQIYPLPHPDAPFLGVHFTVTGDGQMKIGPTAIPAFWRENYAGLDRAQPKELFETITTNAGLFWRNQFNFRKLAIEETKKNSMMYLKHLAGKLVKNFDLKSFNQWSRPGIRAQLYDQESKQLVQDFVIKKTAHTIHLLNAVSPAYTCSLAIAEHIADEFSKMNDH